MTITKDQTFLCLCEIIQTFSDTMGVHEMNLPAHQSKVAKIACAIGSAMELDEDQINGIHIGSMLHDFGIIRIPSSILNKPGKLTDSEYEIVKQHPVHGFQVLKHINFPWPVQRMVLQHHERIDGSGYPGGLEGDDIILEARIIGIADVIDSMTSTRPWREALPVKVAIDEITEHKGTKYDPEIVDACIKIYETEPHLFADEPA